MTLEERAAAMGYTPDWQPLEVAKARAEAEALGIRRVSLETTQRLNREANARMRSKPRRRVALPRPGRRTTRSTRRTLARRTRATSRGTPSASADPEPPWRRLTLKLLGAWLGISAWERKIDDVWAEYREHLRRAGDRR